MFNSDEKLEKNHLNTSSNLNVIGKAFRKVVGGCAPRGAWHCSGPRSHVQGPQGHRGPAGLGSVPCLSEGGLPVCSFVCKIPRWQSITVFIMERSEDWFCDNEEHLECHLQRSITLWSWPFNTAGSTVVWLQMCAEC